MRGRARALLGAVALCVAPTAAGAAQLPQAFELSALAVVAEVSSTQAPAASIITAGLVDATAGFATSALRDGGSAESIAAPVYPGDLVAGGPQLLCQELISCPVEPPVYPLAADAAYPTQPDAKTSVLPDTLASGVASARPNDTSALAVAAALPGLPFTWAVGTASTRAWVTPGVAHVVARSIVHDLSVGPLHVDQLTSTDVVDVPVGGAAVDHPAVEVVGVTLAGQPASVDDKGVHVAGQSQGQTAQSLAQQGISVKLLGAAQQDGLGFARSSAGGLEVLVSVPVKGAPSLPGLPGLDRVYVASVLIGGVGVAAAASSGDQLLAGPPPLATTSSLFRHLAPRVSVRPQSTMSQPRVAAVGGASAQPTWTVPVAHTSVWDLRSVAAALAIVPTTLLLLWRLPITLKGRSE